MQKNTIWKLYRWIGLFCNLSVVQTSDQQTSSGFYIDMLYLTWQFFFFLFKYDWTSFVVETSSTKVPLKIVCARDESHYTSKSLNPQSVSQLSLSLQSKPLHAALNPQISLLTLSLSLQATSCRRCFQATLHAAVASKPHSTPAVASKPPSTPLDSSAVTVSLSLSIATQSLSIAPLLSVTHGEFELYRFLFFFKLENLGF